MKWIISQSTEVTAQKLSYFLTTTDHVIPHSYFSVSVHMDETGITL